MDECITTQAATSNLQATICQIQLFVIYLVLFRL
jgi:hypothetical protein